jgi:thiamine-phosphate diphosphorylase/hydroxyethylthiazole kinase
MSHNDWSRAIPTVSIGGINKTNIQRVLYQSSHSRKGLHGIAIVSAIMGSPDPKLAASTLLNLIKTDPPFAHTLIFTTDVSKLISEIPSLIHKIATQNPLSHNITNTVVQNISANVALALGGSPIMSSSGAEASDLAQLNGSLLLNTGTITPESMHNYILALQAYNSVGGPVVYDPVGAGATSIRREAVKTMLAAGYFSVIKGNEGEILTVYNTPAFSNSQDQAQSQQNQQKGVDSGPSTLSHLQKAQLVKNLAIRTHSVILMTGKIDYLSDGYRTYTISNGHEMLSQTTGSGCVLGTMITCALAVSRKDNLLAVLAAVLVLEIAAEKAAVVGKNGRDVRGPGSFWVSLVDEVWRIREECCESGSRGSQGWLEGAKVVDVSDDV